MDMANNHQGDLAHGRGIIRYVAALCEEKGIRGAVKFQYRQLDTFIHPDHKDAQVPKHIPRFMSTRLPMDDYKKMVDEAKELGLLTACTPFDEESVPVIVEHGIDLIKVASCSARDWPLLERVAAAGKPVVLSTGGAAIEDIDAVVSFFSHKNVALALMHCVAIYPTVEEDLHLNQIDLLRKRYPFLKIGFSTHEDQDNVEAVQIAIGKGAKLLERHVGLPTETVKLNAYSSNPEQLGRWFDAANRAYVMCGGVGRHATKPEEKESLDSLRRGVFARRPLKAGEAFTPADLFYAMPYIDGGMDTSMLTVHSHGLVADRDYGVNEPVGPACLQADASDHQLYSVIHKAKGLLYEGRIAIGKEFDVTLSHHYGIEKFAEVGAIVVDCINREYCKKLIIQVPGQVHPNHYHEKKEETFQVLYGDLIVNMDGVESVLKPGDQVLVERGVPHWFTTTTGCVVEEVSTTHYKNDSFYSDDKIADPDRRKTSLKDARHTFEQYDFSELW
jgi:N-acetylneuraminate synthase